MSPQCASPADAARLPSRHFLVQEIWFDLRHGTLKLLQAHRYGCGGQAILHAVAADLHGGFYRNCVPWQETLLKCLDPCRLSPQRNDKCPHLLWCVLGSRGTMLCATHEVPPKWMPLPPSFRQPRGRHFLSACPLFGRLLQETLRMSSRTAQALPALRASPQVPPKRARSSRGLPNERQCAALPQRPCQPSSSKTTAPHFRSC
mmetsp:Transcript_28205/g.74426  ORF Transcript_28205/g.74426 Transcript_28205/m.74426 type:complete len:203 (+) Transcript_28205:262-870(+)